MATVEAYSTQSREEGSHLADDEKLLLLGLADGFLAYLDVGLDGLFFHEKLLRVDVLDLDNDLEWEALHGKDLGQEIGGVVVDGNPD